MTVLLTVGLFLPLAGAALIRLRPGSGSPRSSAILACALVGASHLISWAALLSLLDRPPEARGISFAVFPFLELAGFSVDFSLRWDALSQLMFMIVTGIGFLIHVYSIGYMEGDERYAYFFADLNLFVFSMLLLVLGGNFLILFAGWELVGLCSYLLIGYWSEKPSAANAGLKAFIVNRIGDAGFIVGILLLATRVGSLDYDEVFSRAPGVIEAGSGLALAIALCLFCGAIGKSAQFPLHVWLPDAMEGPTPVSALIHAATMVTAGVYMVCRCRVIFELAPASLALVAWVGAFTSLLAGLTALAQNDLKRILAFSTISQLGLMFLGAGVGAYDAAMFHLFTHAFFKALLFLCAGSVMHALAGEVDVWKMGGLRRAMPITFLTCLAGTLALAGAPLTAGFFSKDELLWRAFEAHPHGRALWAAGLGTSLLTSLYAFRALWLVFLSRRRYSPERSPHESPPVMLWPLGLLAAGALGAGYLWLPAFMSGSAPFASFLEPVLGGAGHQVPCPGRQEAAMAAAVAVFLVGLGVAAGSYSGGARFAHMAASAAGGLYRAMRARFYFDEIYAAIIVNPLFGLARRTEARVDRSAIDSSFDRLSEGARRASAGGRLWQSGYLRHYALAFSLGAALLVVISVLVPLFSGGGR